mmetsp:Transcript_65305/g.191097  ORF Transcript_65305/g.191097 Transcript_65305/m.191097 type:complete len:209 (-) Transcript_65305:1135-1761(-)
MLQRCLPSPPTVGRAALQSTHMGPRHRGQGSEMCSARLTSSLLSFDFAGPYMVRAQTSARALVPPKPKEDTPWFRWSVMVLQTSIGMNMGKPATSMFMFSCRKWTWGHWHECIPAVMAAMMLTEPAVETKCELWAFLLAMPTGRSSSRRLNVDATDPTSMGSPKAVPVPWFSFRVMSAGVNPESASEPRTHSCWEGPLGAVKLALRPS